MVLGRTAGIIPVSRFPVSRQLFVSCMRTSILKKVKGALLLIFFGNIRMGYKCW